jgi:CRISPR/Cas system-associated exonuclease Cas4 (RecB family)
MKLQYGPYSPSRLETATCPYQFNQQYIKKRAIAKEERLPQGRGSVVHEVFEQITHAYKNNKDMVFDPSQIRKWVTESINRHPIAYEELDAILGMVSKYIDKMPTNLTENSEIERKLAVKLKLNEDGSIATFEDEIDGRMVTRWDFEECDYDDPGAFMRGRADILTISDDLTTLFVYDHKTQPNVEDADTFQMGIYAWVISKCYPFINEFQTVLHFARYGKYSDPYVWTKEDLYRIEEQLITRVEIIESRQNWEQAVPYPNCQYCSFKLECPEFRKLIELDEQTGDFSLMFNNFKVMGDTSRAVKLAGLMNVLDVISTEIHREIKDHVVNYGDLAIAGKVWTLQHKEKVDYDKTNKNASKKKEIMDTFRKYNVDPTEHMGFSETFTKSVWMKDDEYPGLLDELSKAFPRKIEVKFTGVKI